MNMVQLKMYSLAYRKLYRESNKLSQIEVLGRNPKGPVFKSLSTQHSDRDLMSLLQLLVRIDDMVKEDKFYPNINHCPDCDFRDSCHRLCIFNQ